MTEPVAASAESEQPVFFPAGKETAFGVLTRPTAPSNGTAVVLLAGGAWISSMNRNRVWVRLARRLAANGYHVFRMDYHGTGESTGAISGYDDYYLFIDDVAGAVAWLKDQGIDSFFLAGMCVGGLTALNYAHRMDGVKGVILLSPMGAGAAGAVKRTAEGRPPRTVKHVVSRLSDRKRYHLYRRKLKGKMRTAVTRLGRGMTGQGHGEDHWVSSIFLDDIQRSTERRLPTLIAFGDEDQMEGHFFYENWTLAKKGRLGLLLNRADGIVEERLIEGPVHALLQLEIQDEVIDLCEDWLRQIEDADLIAAGHRQGGN